LDREKLVPVQRRGGENLSKQVGSQLIGFLNGGGAHTSGWSGNNVVEVRRVGPWVRTVTSPLLVATEGLYDQQSGGELVRTPGREPPPRSNPRGPQGAGQQCALGRRRFFCRTGQFLFDGPADGTSSHALPRTADCRARPSGRPPGSATCHEFHVLDQGKQHIV